MDLEIDGWLASEIDGRKPHAQEGSFTKDRKRVVRVMREGRLVLQFAYATVVHEWEFVIETFRDVTAQYAPMS